MIAMRMICLSSLQERHEAATDYGDNNSWDPVNALRISSWLELALDEPLSGRDALV
jgi:hypothetical protein